ncbi:MAG: ATP-binding protein [Bdellovibrionales bacterium]|nr:ATP-binding protein [Bdellovibrionales bacterium]
MKAQSLSDFWEITEVDAQGLMFAPRRRGFMFEADGLDGSFLATGQLTALHHDWRSILRLAPGEELQIVYRKRVEFSRWIEDQLSQAFMGESPYGKRILLDRLSDQVAHMGEDEPRLLSQKIIVCLWTEEALESEALLEKRALIEAQLTSFGFAVRPLKRDQIDREIHISSQDLSCSERQEAEWPALKLEAGQVKVGGDCFRALELNRLPEGFTELGMIQSLTELPYPMDVCVRLKARDSRPIVSRLEKKRNLLNAQKGSRQAPAAELESQMDQIDQVLRSLADRSEAIFDLSLIVGLRLPPHLAAFQRKALAGMVRAAAKMDFCDLEETTIGTFDSYLECIPGFSGKNLRRHTVLGSNAVHFLPFFRPSKGDRRAVASFQTRGTGLYAIDPVDSRLANYNWLVSGTSGSGKSFFVNSLLAQSSSIDPNIFIVDIGGSYNKLTQFLGGRVMSLEPGQGFELSPFFLAKSSDSKEERLRRQHVFQIFLEMTRVDGQLPAIEVRHLLSEELRALFELDRLPDRPISAVVQSLAKKSSREAQRLSLLLQPWAGQGFFAQFLDNDRVLTSNDRVLTFDLKGLTEFEDLSRVVQLVVCASLWARIRHLGGEKFSWIVLDEVAFSLLKTQPQFVDELVSTLRKYFAGAVVVVQDLEKVTSNLAGSSILQNTQSKAILQQRGDPRNYSEALSLQAVDRWAIESLRRKKGSFSDVFLIRDSDRTVVRHVPSELEYWLSTTAPEDNLELRHSMGEKSGRYQDKILDFVAHRKSGGH